MNKIKSFEQYIKEEWVGLPKATKGEGSGIGSETADKIFRKVGSVANKFLGMVGLDAGLEADVMEEILDELIKSENEEDRDFIKSQVNRNITGGQIEKKSEEEIRDIVSKEIENVKKINAHLLSK